MENSTVKHFLMIMANAVTRMETATQDFKSALLVLLGYFNENDLNTVVISDGGLERAHDNPETDQDCAFTALIDIPTEGN